MKIVFVMRHSGYVRNFESTLRLLAERGHHVHLAFQTAERHLVMDPLDIASQIIGSNPQLSDGPAPTRHHDAWGTLATELRSAQDYLRYLEPSYRNAPKLRARAERNTVGMVRRIAPKLARVPGGLGGLQVVLRSAEQAVPRSTEVEEFLKRQAPDVLLVTPLVEAGSRQADYLRSARALGIRTGLCVYSWDNLTNKGRIRDVPDLVTVWNEAMRREAMELHGVPAERVVVTGAAAYDQWFEWQPSRTREAFCAEVGIPADRPYVLYVCSSKFIAPAEVPFVREWLGKLRSHADPRLRELGVVVRPHPQNARQWQAVDLGEHGRVAIWPRGGANPVDAEAKAAYYDSIYHSVAVMGVNTSALIESGIVGRPVYTWLADVFRETQEGTLHFHHLLHVNGGLLRVASSFEEHAAQLLGAVEAGEAERESEREQNRRFLEAFVRPYGLGEAATPRLVAAIENLGAQPAPRPIREPLWTPVLRTSLVPLSKYVHRRIVGPDKPLPNRTTGAKSTGEAPPPAGKPSSGKSTGKSVAPPAGVSRVEANGQKADPVAGVDRRVRTLASKAMGAASPSNLLARPRLRDFEKLSESERIKFMWSNVDLIPEKFWYALEARPTPQALLDYESASIVMRTSTKRERLRLRACAKEPWTIEWIEQWIQPDEVLYDVGSNVGAYALVAAKRPGGGARVVAFEPGCTTFVSLCENVLLNSVSDRITPLGVALSDKTSLGHFNYSSMSAGSALHALENERRTLDFNPVFRQPLLTYRLDDLIPQFDLPQPNHLKIDVDGGEVDVLTGAQETLKNPLLRSVMIEVIVPQTDAVIEILERSGLPLLKRIDRPNKQGLLEVWYGLFGRGQ